MVILAALFQTPESAPIGWTVHMGLMSHQQPFFCFEKQFSNYSFVAVNVDIFLHSFLK